MNGAEQKNHRTAVDRVWAATETAVEAIEERLAKQDDQITRMQGEIVSLVRLCGSMAEESIKRDHILAKDLRDAVGTESTHRIQLAKQQRSYVDTQDELNRAVFYHFKDRGFFGRFKWLLTGK